MEPDATLNSTSPAHARWRAAREAARDAGQPTRPVTVAGDDGCLITLHVHDDAFGPHEVEAGYLAEASETHHHSDGAVLGGSRVYVRRMASGRLCVAGSNIHPGHGPDLTDERTTDERGLAEAIRHVCRRVLATGAAPALIEIAARACARLAGLARESWFLVDPQTGTWSDTAGHTAATGVYTHEASGEERHQLSGELRPHAERWLRGRATRVGRWVLEARDPRDGTIAAAFVIDGGDIVAAG